MKDTTKGAAFLLAYIEAGVFCRANVLDVEFGANQKNYSKEEVDGSKKRGGVREGG